jgi:hypothetical protein
MAAYVPTATNPYIDQSSLIFDFKPAGFTSSSFLLGMVAKSLLWDKGEECWKSFFSNLEDSTDELEAILRNDGEATRKQLIMFEQKMMQKNAATSIPYRIQFCRLIGFLWQLAMLLTLGSEITT